jgi:Mrp family chromosome partitioning ATPase
VALGKTDRTAVIDTLDLLKISSTPVLGVVANGIKSSTRGSYYYYQSYYNQESEVEKAKNILQKGLGNRN